MRAERALGVEFGTPRRGLFDDLYGLDPGTVEGEELFDSHAVAFAADGEVAGHVLASVVDRENLALEILNAELVAFLDLDRDADDVACAEDGEVLGRKPRGLLCVDLVYKLNANDSPPQAAGFSAGFLALVA